MLKKREISAWIVTAAALALWLVSTLSPVPYRNVNVTSVTADKYLTYFVASFNKTDCEFRRIEVVGNTAGVNEFIPWYDPTKYKQTDVNRSKGEHTITLTISGAIPKYDWLDVRTRHFCPDVDGADVEYDDNGNARRGLYVDKTFYRITSRDIVEVTQ